MRCADIMKKDIESCRPDAPVRDVAARMRDRNIGFMPVCDGDGKVRGVVTDRDICCRVVAEQRGFDTPVSDCMSTEELVTCRPDDDLVRAQQQMGSRRKSRILVCDENNKLVGVISLSDIAQFEDASTAADTMRRVTDRESRIQ